MLDRVADRAAGEIGGVGERRLSGSDPEGRRGGGGLEMLKSDKIAHHDTRPQHVYASFRFFHAQR